MKRQVGQRRTIRVSHDYLGFLKEPHILMCMWPKSKN